MKKLFFETAQDGFYGTYYENPKGVDCAVIGLFGDDPNDYMAKCGAKWLHKNGVNALCMSPGKHNYSHVNCPLERIETAVKWLMTHGNRKVGIMGMSTAGMEALVAMPFVYEHPTYWKKIEAETKGSGDFQRSTCLFIDSEKNREHTEEEMIKIENIKGKLILIGADDDSLWEAGKYVRRMDQRLQKYPHECEYEAITYKYGTHFMLPESMLRIALQIGLKFVMRFIFFSAKKHPDECEAARKDIDKRLSAALHEWSTV